MADDQLDMLTDARLRTALGARPFRFEPQVGSTNNIAHDWALAGAPAGSGVLTEEQLTGRGRFGRAWSAPPGTALLMSVIVRPHIGGDRLARLTMVGAVAVGEVLETLAPGQVSLKWPNDVWLAGRKVAGVLPEAIWQGEALNAVILGIGLNVRVDFTDTPLADRATSLETVTGSHVDRAVLLDNILRRIDYWSVRVESSALFERWRNWLVTIGQSVTVQSGSAGSGHGATISGQAVEVDQDGALLIRANDGTIQRVIAGEVTLAK